MSFFQVGRRYTGAELQDAPVGTRAHNAADGRLMHRVSPEKGGWDQRYAGRDGIAKGGLGYDYWYVIDSLPGTAEFTNDEVERVALELWSMLNPALAKYTGDPFGTNSDGPITHIDDVMDGGRYRKLAKHVLTAYSPR